MRKNNNRRLKMNNSRGDELGTIGLTSNDYCSSPEKKWEACITSIAIPPFFPSYIDP
jgi:hypothetical protein